MYHFLSQSIRPFYLWRQAGPTLFKKFKLQTVLPWDHASPDTRDDENISTTLMFFTQHPASLAYHKIWKWLAWLLPKVNKKTGTNPVKPQHGTCFFFFFNIWTKYTGYNKLVNAQNANWAFWKNMGIMSCSCISTEGRKHGQHVSGPNWSITVSWWNYPSSMWRTPP